MRSIQYCARNPRAAVGMGVIQVTTRKQKCDARDAVGGPNRLRNVLADLHNAPCPFRFAPAMLFMRGRIG
jgi:hypothetical protein